MSRSEPLSLLWKLGILLAVTMAVGALSYYQLEHYAVATAEQQQRQQQQQMIAILVVANDLDANVRLNLDHFQQRKFPPQYVQDNWLEPHDAEGLVGLKSSRFLARGEPLTLEAFHYDYRHHFSQRLQEHHYAVTVSLGIEQLHHGMLAVGDKVLLYSVEQHTEEALWLDNIEVLAIDQYDQSRSAEAALPSTVSFAMTALQAKRFERMRQLNFQLWLQHPQHRYPAFTAKIRPVLHHMQSARSGD